MPIHRVLDVLTVAWASFKTMPRALPDGLYEHLLTTALARDLESIEPKQLSVESLDPSNSHEVLARHVMLEVARALKSVDGENRVAAQIAITNALLHELGTLAPDAAESLAVAEVSRPGSELRSIFRRNVAPGRPSTPLSSSTLLTRKRTEPSLGAELAREIESADRIDVLVAFISMGGIRALRPALEAFALRGDGKTERLRVLTTVFTGTTEARAIQDLARLPGCQVKISYDTRRTRLHAKAWLLHRNTELHTAYIGSANLTSTALGSGHEWMVKVCAADLPQVIKQFSGTFDVLWSDPEFEAFDPENAESVDRLQLALKQERQPSESPLHLFTLRPYPFQEEILDRLETERAVHNRRRNLGVAATGTGKTLIAAFDYARQVRAAGVRPRLLFLAHRKELLAQARDTFRQVLRDAAFGEMLVDGEIPRAWDHVFASIQSASRQDLLAQRGAEHFRYVVVDECHHAPAESYRALVPHLRPDILLGLTATPERTDGKSLLPDFDGHIAAELRIWHAMERQLLVPFEYYGISDATDLTRVTMTRGGYDVGELAAVYTGNDIRANLIEKQLRDRVADPRTMRALAFCVSVEHAEFMANALSRRGIPAHAVHGQSLDDVRTNAKRRLDQREVNVICTCDLYNEGVDLPFVDTLLMLRPTSSATLFLQQLGRGLRLHPDKHSCLVLDFIGAHRAEFRFDNVLCALSNTTRGKLEQAVERGFQFLPSGCIVQLDRVAQDQILKSLRVQLRGRKRMIEDLRQQTAALGCKPTLAEYLRECDRDLEEIYTNKQSWTSLQRQAGLVPSDDEAEKVCAQLSHLVHIDESARLRILTSRPSEPPTQFETRRYAMLDTLLHRYGAIQTAEQVAAYLTEHEVTKSEVAQLAEALDERISLARDIYPAPAWPLALHRHYESREVLAAIGRAGAGQNNPGLVRGIFKVPNTQQELLFVTLDKSTGNFSPTTRYLDYALSPTRFRWETPSTATITRDSGRRYIESPENGWSFFLFVRTDNAAPYAFLGPARYVSHEGDRPIQIEWELETPLPAALFDRYATLIPG